ncbi:MULTISPECIES: hypothetical protein [Caulobacter]|jgi:hypothetical protein|uniref:Uncharacterized protein n=1 Tax=Caulobacter vibrioides OR37 TaxID=1292034 RepID=R0CW46_CAUVI|nr:MULTISPECIES: hypothetical protein [Caulobacter]ENZ80701.1 hypothetical protein OR37_03419 [Caulobacter vibrioides OR37]MBQ1560836.1 hypothetical protein [Caulobacter sp.]
MLAALLLTAAVTACPAEKAVYALRTEPAVTARFVPVASDQSWPSGVALRLDFHGKQQWFLPAIGGSNGENYMDRTTDPGTSGWKLPDPDGGWGRLGDFQYLGFDAGYTLLLGVPRAGQPAPAHMLLPTLDDALRHPRDGVDRDSLPRQFFDLVACKGL